MNALPCVTAPSPAQARPASSRLHPNPTTDIRATRLPPRPTLAGSKQQSSRTTMDRRDVVSDEHAILVWQTCGYVEDFGDAARAGVGQVSAFDLLLRFLHYRLLSYLSAEERQLAAGDLKPAQRVQQIIDHFEIREAVEAIEAAETEAGALLASDALVTALDAHVRGEESWMPEHGGSASDVSAGATAGWALPLLLTDDIDLDTLPTGFADELVLTRLQRMRCGEALRLRSHRDLASLWQQVRTRCPGEHTWAYETTGPENWVARITRREADFS
jgi:uncharacterized protein (DUF2249 family)